MGIVDHINAASDRSDFLRLVRTLAMEYKENPQKWANRTIDEYLESIASWVEDYSECAQNDVDWESADYRLILRLLYMGGIYE